MAIHYAVGEGKYNVCLGCIQVWAFKLPGCSAHSRMCLLVNTLSTSVWYIPGREFLGHSALVDSANRFTNHVTFTSVKMGFKPRCVQLRNLHVLLQYLFPKLPDK